MKKFVAGFDPGGRDKRGRGIFGWCVVALDSWRVVDKGVVSYAAEAFGKMQQAMNGGQLSAAGIDAPLYWSQNGLSRESDKHVRRQTGASSGTVQAVNSLQGACLIQGFLLAQAIESKYPNCVITETHPKALLRIYPEAGEWDGANNEHQRDALTSAWVAKNALGGNGENLFCRENTEDMHVFLKKTMYWWPN